MTGAAELGRLYDDLARFQLWSHRALHPLSRKAPLEMHKRLADGDGPDAGTAGLNDWLWRQVTASAAMPEPRVLDVGCGFGATLLRVAELEPSAELVGLTLSAYQVRVATREAARRGLERRLRALVRSFDEPPPGPFDVALSIESLFHAPDLARSIEAIAGVLTHDGRLALVEDMATDPNVASSRAARSLLELWRTKRLHTSADYDAAFERAGLRVVNEHDLTARVPSRTTDELERGRRSLDRWRRFAVGGLRGTLDAFRGGLDLEELYATGSMRYRVLVAERA